MITAENARGLLNDSTNLEHKSIWFKIRLWWTCGVLNRQIQHAASTGETSVTLYDYRQSLTFQSQYFPFIKKFYNQLGFYVGFNDPWKTYPVISWEHPIDEDGKRIYKKVTSNKIDVLKKIDWDETDQQIKVTSTAP